MQVQELMDMLSEFEPYADVLVVMDNPRGSGEIITVGLDEYDLKTVTIMTA